MTVWDDRVVTMTDEAVRRAHDRFWRDGLGTVSADEMLHFRDVIAEHRPRSFVEIGTASGLSGGLICSMLEACDGERFVTIDHDNTFFGDPTKENGYLISEIYSGSAVEVVRRPFSTSLDVPYLGEAFDMGFVDANHQHPWPMIDTLCLYPVMTGPKLVMHDDLNLYRHQPTGRGVGPKVVFDQFPEAYRTRYAANHGNVFSLSLDIEAEHLERLAMDAFAVPWTLTRRLTAEQVERLRGVMCDHFTPRLATFFDKTLERYNHPTGRHYLAPANRRP